MKWAIVVPDRVTTWSVGERVGREPAAVAVDSDRRPVAFGSAAIHRASSGLGLVEPFTAARVRDPRLTSDFLHWLLRGSKRHRLIPVLVLPADPVSVVDAWSSLVRHPIIVPRVVAEGVGLGLDIDAEVGRMIVDLRGDGHEVAIVADGRIHRAVGGRSNRPEDVAATVRSVLSCADPDLEWDVRQGGLHFVGDVGPAWIERFRSAVAVTLRSVTAPDDLIWRGARRAMTFAGRLMAFVPRG